MIRTLWLASWYPSESSPQNGDFIQRHAQAVSRFAKVHVLHVVSLVDAEKKTEVSITETGNLTEEIVLYRKRGNHLLSKCFSFFRYIYLSDKHIRRYIKTDGKPEIIHVHVCMRAGLFALWLKKRYGISYVITEHSTIYTREDNPNFYAQNFLFRHYARKIFKHTALVLPDSKDLGKNIQEMVADVPFIKVANTVSNDFYFKRKENENELFTFIHASSLIERKNPKGIIRTFARLLEYNNSVFLKIIGNKNAELEDLARQLNISADRISFTDQIPYEEYAAAMRSANAFILFSHSENFGCVVVESLCCGNPVIATNVGGVAEQINDSNSILINANDEATLLDAMKKIIENYACYDRKKIAEQAMALYSYDAIGRQIAGIYEKILYK